MGIGESRASTVEVTSRLQRVLKRDGELWRVKGQSARLVTKDISCDVPEKGIIEISLPFDCAPRAVSLRVRFAVATHREGASMRVIAEDPVSVDVEKTTDAAAREVSAIVADAFRETFGPEAREACFQALLSIAAERLKVKQTALRGIAAVDGALIFVANASKR